MPLDELVPTVLNAAALATFCGGDETSRVADYEFKARCVAYLLTEKYGISTDKIQIQSIPSAYESMDADEFKGEVADLLTTAKAIDVVGNGSKIITVRSYQRSFELLLKKQKISHHGFHALRHTFATRAIECGMDVKSLSEILGHKNPTITLKRYVHSFMEHKREYMNRLGKLL